MPEPAVPVPASTVVVVRGSDPFEVLLLRRHAAMSFMAGLYVFPGGGVDDADRLAKAAAIAALPGERPRLPAIGPAEELAVRVAGARELVEEAGVLLAWRDGRSATAGEAAEVRDRLRAGADFVRLLADGGWSLPADTIIPFGWIVTPRAAPRRFDTHFLVALLPPEQEASTDAGESDELLWIEPSRAIRAEEDALAIAPPTWFTLALLAQHASPDALLAWARDREIVRIEPVLEAFDSGRRVTFPNDPLLRRWHGPEGIVFEPGSTRPGTAG